MQIFLNKKEKKSHIERAEKLRNIIKRAHTGKKNVAEKLIFMVNVYTVNFGLKCIEAVNKSSTKKKHLDAVQASPQRYLNKYEELHNFIKSHYKILESSKIFICNYSGITFYKYFHVEQVLKVQRKKKGHCWYSSSTLNHIPSCKLDNFFSCE